MKNRRKTWLLILNRKSESDEGVWSTNIFGKTPIEELVMDGNEKIKF